MNLSVLNQKVRALKLFPRLSPPALDKLEQLLPRLDGWQLLRINPYAFAGQHGFDAADLLDILVHGAKVGLFDFKFGQICPNCGGIEHNAARLDGIQDGPIHCTVCARLVESTMDEYLEVSFSVSEALDPPTVDPLADLRSYMDYFHSANFQVPEAHLRERLGTFMDFLAVGPDETGRMTLELEPDRQLRLVNFESHTHLVISAEGAPAPVPQLVDIDLLSNGLSPQFLTLAPGRVELVVHNRFKGAVGLVSQHYSQFQTLQLASASLRPGWARFLTGKAFLNNQSFRELFRIQAYAPDMKLKIKNLTVLFTDLKGSTDMYGRVGDISAFDVVQRHFALLTDVVRTFEGAIVKTMGDAIMATFSSSQDGVLASLEMVRRMADLQRQVGNSDLGIKIGLHEGPALAVNADDRLDYFGQNINLAARVQGLAESGEIWMTEAVFASPGVAEALGAARVRTEEKLATLKGISRPTPVLRVWT